MSDAPVIRLERWAGPWADDDPDGAFKAEVAALSQLDPLVTLEGMSRALDIPVGALARYALARWATAGSGGLLEVGPDMVERLAAEFDAAERAGTDAARLEAYARVRGMVSWLRAGLDDPDASP